MSRGFALAVVLFAAALVLAAPAVGADEVLTRDRTAANVSTHSGQPVWSRVGRDGQARLVQRLRGRNRDLPVAPKAGLFDPDVGTTPRGNMTVVYSRCAGLSGQGCDIWQYDGFDLKERKVRGASTASCSEFAPSVWLGSVAFARTGPGRCNGLYVVRRGKLRKLDVRVPADTDLRGGRVAYLYVPPGDTFRSYLRVRNLRDKRSRLIVTGFAAERESYGISSPVLTGRYVHWLQEDRVRNDFFAGRALVGRRPVLEFTQRTFPGRVDSIAITRERFYYTNGRGLYLATDPQPIFAARG
ncbi:MAG TPA: hypothetical protein VFB51_13210 [Solirubrobacterales bacterium]|nr:hypothetical protein [Solirubrobacterales bacterium]